MDSDAALDAALQDLLGRPAGSPPLAALRLRLLGSEEIRARTSGEVVSSIGFSRDTLEPFPGGLFCERLFGPLDLEAEREDKDARLRAFDSPFRRARDHEVVAPRERMVTFARITLARAIEHPLLRRPGWRARLGDAGLRRWTIEAVPVLPPDLRAILPIVEGDQLHFATPDLNELYSVVIQANIRLLRLRELRAPPTILDVEDAQLEEAVHQLVDNAGSAEPRTVDGRPLVGLLGMVTHPSRASAWQSLAELDGMVARGVVRALEPPLAKRSFSLLAHLWALGIEVEIACPCEHEAATVH